MIQGEFDLTFWANLGVFVIGLGFILFITKIFYNDIKNLKVYRKHLDDAILRLENAKISTKNYYASLEKKKELHRLRNFAESARKARIKYQKKVE